MSSESGTPAARPRLELVGRLRALTIGRLVGAGVLALLLGTIGRGLVDPAATDVLNVVGPLYVGGNALLLALPRHVTPQRLALDLSLIVDIATIAWVLAITGGPASPLALLLYAEAVAITLAFGWWTGVRVAALASVALAWLYTVTPPALLRVPAAVDAADAALGVSLDPLVRVVLLGLGLWAVVALVASLSSVTERNLRGLIDDLAMLREVNHELDPRRGLAQICDGLASTLVGTFGYRRAVLWVAEDDELVATGGAGLSDAAHAELGSRRLSPDAYPVGHALREGRPWPVPRREPRPGAVSRLLGDASPLVLVPLGSVERPLGLLSAEVSHRTGQRPRLRGRDVRLLSMLAGEAGLVLDNARLHNELRARAVTDPLTGLPNHGFIQQRLDEECARLTRRADSGEHRELSVVLIDLDHFKDVNDTFGHPVGDAVLRAVAGALEREVRESDVAGRYGGEEFALVLPDTSGPSAERACARVRAAMGALEVLDESGEPVGRLTASFGISTAVGASHDRATMVRQADEALYEAKRLGRDRVVHYERTRSDVELLTAHEVR